MTQRSTRSRRFTCAADVGAHVQARLRDERATQDRYRRALDLLTDDADRDVVVAELGFCPMSRTSARRQLLRTSARLALLEEIVAAFVEAGIATDEEALQNAAASIEHSRAESNALDAIAAQLECLTRPFRENGSTIYRIADAVRSTDRVVWDLP